MDFRLLGPFEVAEAGGRVVDAGRPAQRALLALLLLNANRVVALRTICDGLWGDEPPSSAANSVQVYISRLRKVLGADLPLTMVAGGYRLKVPPETIDVVLFERLAAEGGSALERGDPAAAVITLRAALDLRRGPPLAEFAEIPFAAAECARINRLVRLAEENHAEARLAAGQHRGLVGDLERLVELDPFSERCWGLLMTALYRCGRQADALAAYQRARRILIEQLGIEPGPELCRIEAGVLAQSLPPAEAQVSSTRGRVNLPSRAASFVGRDREVAELERLMATARLVMLTGPGGCGKTSLAIALARATAGSYADGLWFVDLAPLGSPGQVPGAVCDALGVRQPPGRTLVQTAAEYVGHQNALVILDNCEHVLEASREVAEAMLRAGPAVKVLATSREQSGLPGEVIWQVPPLADSDAVRLFTERAESALASFRLGAQTESVVTGICRRLDCIPLAIELAAARVSALSPAQIAARMDDALSFLGRRPASAIARQRTLRATLDWSYDLLSVPERRLLARLAVFAGGFTLEAVEAVGRCEEVPAQDVVDLFTRLVDKSLVTRVGSGETDREPRYRLLETIRQYAWARLAEQDGDEAARVRSDHAAYHLELAEKIEPNLYLAGSRPWFDRADAEHDNFGAALEWAFGGGPDAEIGPRLVAALAWAWFIDGRIAEGRAWADHALAVTEGQRTLVRGRALLAGAALASAQSDLDHQAQLAGEAISLGDELGSAFLYAAGLDWLGLARWAQGNLEEAVTLLEQAAGLHGGHGNKWYEAACSAELGRALADSGRLGEARQMLDLGVRRARRLGEDAALGFTLDARALFALKCGELDTAAEIIGEAVGHYRASGYLEGLASGLNTQAFAAIGRGDPASAAASFAEALAACRRLGHLGGAATALAGLARVADMTGDAVRAAEFCAAAAALRAQAGAGLAGPEQASLDELTSRLAAQLGPAAFGDAWASGQAIRLDQAQELAASTRATAGGRVGGIWRPGRSADGKQMPSGRDHADLMNSDPVARESPADALRATMRGPVLAPGDPGYDAARRVWNGSISKHPALVARCTGVADVIAALRFAASHDLPVSVRGGGHSFAGFGTCDDGLVIDLVLMKGIRVDPRTRRVIAQGGVTWGELDHETAAFGLATTGGLISTTGIGGLTLGGGIGWLMRQHGLACDNLVAADVVTADGQMLHVSGDEHPDLFWALRGGGGNFGIVTAFEYQLHPVSTVLAGALVCPGERAAEVMKHYAAWAADEPDELCTLVEFAAAPDADFIPQAHRGQPAVFVVLCHCGPLADAEAAVGGLRDALPVIADLVEPMPYPAMQSFFDEDYPAGLWSYTKSHYLDHLDGAAVAALAAAAAALPGRSFIDLHHLEGAPSRTDPQTAAFDHRKARYAVVFGGVCEDEADFAGCRAWAQEHWSALASHATGSAYSNFMADADDDAVRAAWGPGKYARLVAVKGRYDPANRFRFNHNIPPAIRGAGS